MQVYCATCQQVFVGASRCPRCGGELVAPEEATPVDPHNPGAPEPIGRPTMLHRFVVGSLVALGLYLGFRRFAGGLLLLIDVPPQEWWDSVVGLSTIFGLQTAAVLVGGLLGGSARPRGFATGLLIGVLCGGLFLASEVFDGTPPQLLALYVQPLLLGVLGGIAAGIGSRVWPATPEIDTPVRASKTLSSIQLLMSDLPKQTERPTSWLKVMLGIALMSVGMLLADDFRTAIQKSTSGLFKTQSVGQARFVSFQLAALAVLVGGMTAAAGTGAGVRHGLYASLVSAAVVVGTMSARQNDLPSPVSYTLDLLNVPSQPLTAAALAMGCTLVLCGVASGWLGGQLFLPLAPAHLRHRLKMID